MYLYSRESGVPDLGLFQSHPTHMYLYVPHALLHVPKVLKKAGGEESVLRKNFLSPGGTRVAGPSGGHLGKDGASGSLGSMALTPGQLQAPTWSYQDPWFIAGTLC